MLIKFKLAEWKTVTQHLAVIIGVNCLITPVTLTLPTFCLYLLPTWLFPISFLSVLKAFVFHVGCQSVSAPFTCWLLLFLSYFSLILQFWINCLTRLSPCGSWDMLQMDISMIFPQQLNRLYILHLLNCQSIVFLFRLAPVSTCIHLPGLPVALCTDCSFKRQNAQLVVSPVKIEVTKRSWKEG